MGLCARVLKRKGISLTFLRGKVVRSLNSSNGYPLEATKSKRTWSLQLPRKRLSRNWPLGVRIRSLLICSPASSLGSDGRACSNDKRIAWKKEFLRSVRHIHKLQNPWKSLENIFVKLVSVEMWISLFLCQAPLFFDNTGHVSGTLSVHKIIQTLVSSSKDNKLACHFFNSVGQMNGCRYSSDSRCWPKAGVFTCRCCWDAAVILVQQLFPPPKAQYKVNMCFLSDDSPVSRVR